MTIAYIAGPMTGLTDFNYPAFEAAAEKLRAQGWTVVSPHELHDGDTSHPYGYYLRRDLVAMLGCDEVITLPGWRESRGARLEITVAEALDMPVYDYSDEAQHLHRTLLGS